MLTLYRCCCRLPITASCSEHCMRRRVHRTCTQSRPTGRLVYRCRCTLQISASASRSGATLCPLSTNQLAVRSLIRCDRQSASRHTAQGRPRQHNTYRVVYYTILYSLNRISCVRDGVMTWTWTGFGSRKFRGDLHLLKREKQGALRAKRLMRVPTSLHYVRL